MLSSIFLNERLNLQGKIGCALCILGAVMIVIHSPDQQSASTIDEFSKLFFAPGEYMTMLVKTDQQNVIIYID